MVVDNGLIACTLSFLHISFFYYILFLLLAFLLFWPLMQGKCLTKDMKQPSYIVSLFDWLWARTIAAILWPLHMLAKKVVYSKIHSSIGISKVRDATASDL